MEQKAGSMEEGENQSHPRSFPLISRTTMTTAPAAALAAPPTHGAIEPVKATQKAARLLAMACQMKTACRDDVPPTPTQGSGIHRLPFCPASCASVAT